VARFYGITPQKLHFKLFGTFFLVLASSAIFSIILLGAIFMIKGLDKFSGGQFTGWEFDLVMLAACLMIIITGPGKASISHLIKRIPRLLQ
jgi:putative oxidoreductase